MAGVTREDRAAGNRLPDRMSIGVLTTVFPPALVDEVIEAAQARELRKRSLPARLMVYFTLALWLFAGCGYDTVLRNLVEGLAWVLDRFSDTERSRLGVHTCPGGDQDSVHSLDIDYAGLLPELFGLHVGTFYLQLASEPDPTRVLEIVRDYSRDDQRIFVGVTDPIDPRVETPEEVRDRVLLAARYIPVERLGTCDDCGFSPFADDTSTSRETAFAKIEARVRGTQLAAEQLGI